MSSKTSSKFTTATASRQKKTVQKQPLSVPDRLKRLFTTLCAQIEGGHNPNAIKTCDKILRLQPNDPDALQTKLFLLLTTNQSEAALSLIQTDLDGESKYMFERAYAHYCLHRKAETREVLRELKEGEGENEDRRVMHLEAQLNYREGLYQASYDIYNQLLDTAPAAEEQSDILTNIQAVQEHLDFINSNFLHALDTLPSSLAGSLESLPPPPPPSSSLPILTSTISTKEKDREEEKKKPPRKSRIPAGVIPGVTPPPDPERWLKKSERSTFNVARKRKGAAGGGGATQGSSVGLESAVTTGGTVSGGGGASTKGKGKKRK